MLRYSYFCYAIEILTYSQYTTSASAQYAMQYLNNTEIQGQKIKIQVANPPSDPRAKRARTN